MEQAVKTGADLDVPLLASKGLGSPPLAARPDRAAEGGDIAACEGADKETGPGLGKLDGRRHRWTEPAQKRAVRCRGGGCVALRHGRSRRGKSDRIRPVRIRVARGAQVVRADDGGDAAESRVEHGRILETGVEEPFLLLEAACGKRFEAEADDG